jgi:hypothetical protein
VRYLPLFSFQDMRAQFFASLVKVMAQTNGSRLFVRG